MLGSPFVSLREGGSKGHEPQKRATATRARISDLKLSVIGREKWKTAGCPPCAQQGVGSRTSCHNRTCGECPEPTAPTYSSTTTEPHLVPTVAGMWAKWSKRQMRLLLSARKRFRREEQDPPTRNGDQDQQDREPTAQIPPPIMAAWSPPPRTATATVVIVKNLTIGVGGWTCEAGLSPQPSRITRYRRLPTTDSAGPTQVAGIRICLPRLAGRKNSLLSVRK
jgi:hypothetical protein